MPKVISLLTDAPKYNLAIMKLSAHYKAEGYDVMLNDPIQAMSCGHIEKTFASVLFDWNKDAYIADAYGGPQFPQENLPPEVEYIHERKLYPDYELYGLDFSIGYTFRPCYRKCDFCLVKTFKQPDKKHHSIYEFHPKHLKKICLMNNNTFLDVLWKRTFEEIWKEDLTVLEHGMDLRLMDEEKADAIKKTKFDSRVHFAWDRMRDEELIVKGLNFIKPYKIEARVYVLAGYDTTWEQDLYRCQILINYNQVPYIMPFKDVGMVSKVKNYINSLDWWHYRDNILKGFNDSLVGVKHEKSKEVKKKKEIQDLNCSLFDD